MFLSLLQTGAKDTFIFSLRLLIGFRLAKIHFMRPPGKKFQVFQMHLREKSCCRGDIFISILRRRRRIRRRREKHYCKKRKL